MADLGPGCLLDGLMNWLVPKTPWRLFVVLVILGALFVVAAAVLHSQ
jgi:hypothetical protein